MGCLAYNYSCSQVTASFMAAPFTYHLCSRLDRFRLLLVSPSFVPITKDNTDKKCGHETIRFVYITRDRMGNTSRCWRSYAHPHFWNIADEQRLPLQKQQKRIKQDQVKAITQIHAKTLSISSDMEGSTSLLLIMIDMVLHCRMRGGCSFATIYTDMRTMTRLDCTRHR